jgi:cytochrome bd ubiquinol oxidase subunit II
VSAADAILVLLWAGLTAYALFAGADFGGGFWDLVAIRPQGEAARSLIAHAIGPVWEANHVWLIFAIVVTWTAFPPVFAAVASTLYIPLTVVAIGIILRGSAFAFRGAISEPRQQRWFGILFGLSSIITPFFLGAAAGAIASGRVPAGNAAGDPFATWLTPTSLYCGTLAVGICAYLAAVYLTADARREGNAELADAFRGRALRMGVAVGAAAFVGMVAVLPLDAPILYRGLTSRALAIILLSAVAGAASLWLLLRRRFGLARLGAGLAVGSVLWAWAVAQYPNLLVGSLSVNDAAAAPSTLEALLGSLLVGAGLVLPGVAALFLFAQRPRG